MSEVLVLCYHAISPTWPAALSTRLPDFDRQLRYLRRAGYVGATFTRAVTDPPARRVVAVTFDDAYRSVLDLARPVLEAMGWPATVFAPTDFVGSERPMSWPGIEGWLGGPHEHELIPLGWDALRDLSARGWEVGSHTCSHPRLTQLDDAALEHELASSRARVEDELSAPCVAIAYPYGDVDDRVIATALGAGYASGAALPPRWHERRPFEEPRVGVWHGEPLWRFVAKTARPLRDLRTFARRRQHTG
jgi:peptidoglycan/xylan/chitin deacetylase (PgdA/CDA1 family)